MHGKCLLTAVVLATFTSPAFAATTYYVVQDAKTHKCSVTNKQADGKALILVGTTEYASKADADKAMKAAAECKAR